MYPDTLSPCPNAVCSFIIWPIFAPFWHFLITFGNKETSRQININRKSSFPHPVRLWLRSSFTSVCASQPFPVSEEDLMNISLWVGECKTNMSLDLSSLLHVSLEGGCEMHLKPCEIEAHTVFWHLHCLFLLKPNPLQSSDRHGKQSWWQRICRKKLCGTPTKIK